MSVSDLVINPKDRASHDAAHEPSVEDMSLCTASKVKHRLNIFLEKTMKLSKYVTILITFMNLGVNNGMVYSEKCKTNKHAIKYLCN